MTTAAISLNAISNEAPANEPAQQETGLTGIFMRAVNTVGHGLKIVAGKALEFAKAHPVISFLALDFGLTGGTMSGTLLGGAYKAGVFLAGKFATAAGAAALNALAPAGMGITNALLGPLLSTATTLAAPVVNLVNTVHAAATIAPAILPALFNQGTIAALNVVAAPAVPLIQAATHIAPIINAVPSVVPTLIQAAPAVAPVVAQHAFNAAAPTLLNAMVPAVQLMVPAIKTGVAVTNTVSNNIGFIGGVTNMAIKVLNPLSGLSF